jgi:hypothetical protein
MYELTRRALTENCARDELLKRTDCRYVNGTAGLCAITPRMLCKASYPAAAGRVDVALPDKQEEVATSRESL